MRRVSLRCAALAACGMMSMSASVASAASVQLDGTIRDFHGSFTSTSPFTRETNGHPHFEIHTIDPVNPFAPSRIPAPYGGILGVVDQSDAAELGIVAETIGADRKPVYVGGTPGSVLFQTTRTKYTDDNTNLELNTNDAENAANFNQWFNDTTNINQSQAYSLTLDDPEDDGVFTHEDNSFFPINNQLFGNEGRANNYHFTIELHSTFTYQTGQSFTFTGDDDVWVFINDQRVIDLGGLHQALSATVDLDTLGLTVGNEYTFDFFFAERNTTESNFRIDTSIALGGDVDPPPPPVIPLPAAAIPGFFLLGGLGGLAGLKNCRRRRQR